VRHLNRIRTLLTLEGLSGIELLRNDWTKILKVVAGGAPTGGDQRARRQQRVGAIQKWHWLCKVERTPVLV
jgi:hypothetical protein